MVAAALLLRDHGIVVSTLFLEAGQHHAVLICEALAAARSYISYTTLERVVALPRKRALIGCAVYPDPFIPLPALEALSLGVPVLVGPVGSSSAYADALNDMSVPFWEDSRDIAEALSRLFKHRDKIMQNYNKVVAEPLLT